MPTTTVYPDCGCCGGGPGTTCCPGVTLPSTLYYTITDCSGQNGSAINLSYPIAIPPFSPPQSYLGQPEQPEVPMQEVLRLSCSTTAGAGWEGAYSYFVNRDIASPIGSNGLTTVSFGTPAGGTGRCSPFLATKGDLAYFGFGSPNAWTGAGLVPVGITISETPSPNIPPNGPPFIPPPNPTALFPGSIGPGGVHRLLIPDGPNAGKYFFSLYVKEYPPSTIGTLQQVFMGMFGQGPGLGFGGMVWYDPYLSTYKIASWATNTSATALTYSDSPPPGYIRYFKTTFPGAPVQSSGDVIWSLTLPNPDPP